MGCPWLPVRLLDLKLLSFNTYGSSLSGSFPQTQLSPLYFDRTDVKKAIHAPINVDWEECSNVNVFPHGDASLPSAFTVLPNVIEKSNRSVIVHGLADFILIAEGSARFLFLRIVDISNLGASIFRTRIVLQK
jgi:hypothetical protein